MLDPLVHQEFQNEETDEKLFETESMSCQFHGPIGVPNEIVLCLDFSVVGIREWAGLETVPAIMAIVSQSKRFDVFKSCDLFQPLDVF